MNDFAEALKSLVSVPEFGATLGWILAAAIVIGGLLDDDARNVYRWLFAVAVYLLLQELARAVLFTATQHTLYKPVALTLVVSLMYALGIVMGWGVVKIARARVRKTFRNENKKEGE